MGKGKSSVSVSVGVGVGVGGGGVGDGGVSHLQSMKLVGGDYEHNSF